MNHWMLHRIARMPTKLLVICARKQQRREQQQQLGRGRGKLKNIAWPCCICQDKQDGRGKAWGFEWFYNSIWRWQSYGILSVNLIDLALKVSEIMVVIRTAGHTRTSIYAYMYVFLEVFTTAFFNRAQVFLLLCYPFKKSTLPPFNNPIHFLYTHHISIVNSLHEAPRKEECQLFISLSNYLHNPPLSLTLPHPMQIQLASRAGEFTRRLKVCNEKFQLRTLPRQL